MVKIYESWHLFPKACLFVALLGSAIFVVNTLLVLLGVSENSSGDDGQFDDADVSFKIFSVQGLSCFFMIFGWTALAGYLDYSLNALFASSLAAILGGCAVLTVKKLYSSALKLKSCKTLEISSALLCVGEVYLSINQNDIGKVQLSLQGRYSILDAKSENSESIPTGAKVKVVDLEGEILIVKEV